MNNYLIAEGKIFIFHSLTVLKLLLINYFVILNLWNLSLGASADFFLFDDGDGQDLVLDAVDLGVVSEKNFNTNGRYNQYS